MIERIQAVLDAYASNNFNGAVHEPDNTFEELVNTWHEKAQLLADIKDALKPLAKKEMRLRQQLAESLTAWLGDGIKEGVNNYALSNGHTLKFGYKVTRTIDASKMQQARQAYPDTAEVQFDNMLRIKYELDTRGYRNIAGDSAAVLAISRMVIAKPATPTIEVK